MTDVDLKSMTPAPAPALAKRALVVEDEKNIRELVTFHLGLEGLVVKSAATGDEAIRLSQSEPFDVIVLDLMLPGVDGITVCRAIRRQDQNGDVPILMLTARRDETDKVLGLESGADDYLTKPFGVRELVARVRALLRRPRASAPAQPEEPAIEVGALRIDRARREVRLDGRELELTPHEFEALALMASRPGIVFSRQALLEAVWAPGTHVTDRSVDTLVKRLRQKIEVDTANPRYILTVWGTGYKFADG
jgi:two-component system alkaline phosphatase synthesis response regulator PhoP